MVSSVFLSLAFILPSLRGQYVAGNEVYSAHTRLLNNLLADYDKISLPSPRVGVPVNVTLGIAVTQIVKVKWKDYRLAWVPKQYQNITEFKIDSDYLWIPDIALLKPMTSDAAQVLGITKDEADLSWKISVSSDGTAVFNFPGMIYGQCALNIADYPFDEHSCSFVFSSWTHDGSGINLTLRDGNPLDFNNYIQNNEWFFVDKSSENIDEKYNCCEVPFRMIGFHVRVKRGASSYISNYIIPSILIAILSLMMFTLPPEVGKRMEIGINLLLCLSVYLTILNTKMPTRSDVFPLLSKFYGCCIFILTCALLCTCWVVTYYFHDMSGWKIYSMSKFVQVGILYYLARVLRFSNTKKVFPSGMLDTVDNQMSIDVKPANEEQTNFTINTSVKNPDDESNAKDRKKQNCDLERKTEKHVTSKEISQSGNQNLSVNEEHADRDDKNDKQTASKHEQDEVVNEEKINKENSERKTMKDIDQKETKQVEAKPMEAKAKPKNSKEKVEDKAVINDETSSEMKRKASDDEILKNENDSGVTAEKNESSQSSPSKKSEKKLKKKKQTSSTVSPGLMEANKKTRRKKKIKEIGVVNREAIEEDVTETGNEKDGGKSEEQSKEEEPVREAPSLQSKEDENGTPVESEDKNEGGGFDKKVTTDFWFDTTGRNKKKHESIKWLQELAQHYADHSQRKRNRYQWRQAATVLNRLFIIILIISIAISVIAVFLVR